MTDISSWSNLTRLRDAQLGRWPEHASFIDRRFKADKPDELHFADGLAAHVLRLAGDELADFCDSYKWICTAVLAEEEHFRRHHAYRLTSFEDAYEQVYSRPEIMRPYMRGLLMTQVWWSNHTASMSYYINRFLAGNKPGYHHVEIGPGHGLLLYPALDDPRCASATAWDLSEASLDETRRCLAQLGATRIASLEMRDLYSEAAVARSYDSVVISEVLEHLEKPRAALERLRGVMAPGGRIFVNMPINSPAPDHLFLLRSPDEVRQMVADAGFVIEDAADYPATGYSLAAAIKHKLTVSCVVTGRCD